MRNSISPGKDNIPTELYKNGRQPLIHIPHRLIKVMHIQKQLSTYWKSNFIVPIHNERKKLQYHNDTRVSLLCTRYKILATVINNR